MHDPQAVPEKLPWDLLLPDRPPRRYFRGRQEVSGDLQMEKVRKSGDLYKDLSNEEGQRKSEATKA